MAQAAMKSGKHPGRVLIVTLSGPMKKSATQEEAF
jgi:hypothetical protein